MIRSKLIFNLWLLVVSTNRSSDMFGCKKLFNSDISNSIINTALVTVTTNNRKFDWMQKKIFFWLKNLQLLQSFCLYIPLTFLDRHRISVVYQVSSFCRSFKFQFQLQSIQFSGKRWKTFNLPFPGERRHTRNGHVNFLIILLFWRFRVGQKL